MPKSVKDSHPDLWAGQGGVDHTTEVLRPNVSCWRQSGRKGGCNNKHCLIHGHRIREAAAGRRCRYDYQNCDTYSLTLPFAAWVGYPQFRIVVSAFLKRLRYKRNVGRVPYWYETEFVNVLPHLHLVFRLPLGSDLQAVSDKVRACWKAALASGNVPWTSQRVGVRLVGKTRKDVYHLFRYNLKTNKGAIPVNNCRPKGWSFISYTHPGWRQNVECVEPEDALTLHDHCVDCFNRAAAGVVVQKPEKAPRQFHDTFEVVQPHQERATVSGCNAALKPRCVGSGALVVLTSPTPPYPLDSSRPPVPFRNSVGVGECKGTNAPLRPALSPAVQPRPPPRSAFFSFRTTW